MFAVIDVDKFFPPNLNLEDLSSFKNFTKEQKNQFIATFLKSLGRATEWI
jgi:hypothetical protein